MTKIHQFWNTYYSEIFGFFSGGSTGTLAYIKWEDTLITCALAVVTGLLGSFGASLWNFLNKKYKIFKK